MTKALTTPTPVKLATHIPAVLAAAENAFPMFTLGGMANTVPKKAGAKDYPVFPDPDGKVTDLAARIKVNEESFKALEGSLEADKKELAKQVMTFWFEHNEGKGEPASSVIVKSPEGDVRVQFQDRFKMAASPQAVAQVLGAENARLHFRQAWELKVKGDQLPDTPDTQGLLNEVMALFTRHGLAKALEFKSSIKPKKGFNKVRHVLFTVAQNLVLNDVCPMIPQVKCSGVGGDNE